MKIKSVLVNALLVCCMMMLLSCDGGSSSTSEYNPTLSGQQQKNLALAQIQSDAMEQFMYEELIKQGLSPAAARATTDCFMPEATRLIQNTPAEQFEVSESEAMKLGERIGIHAANNCLSRIS